MPRVRRGFKARRRRKKWLKLAKGHRGGRHRMFRKAKESVIKALTYAYRDRRQKKRQFRRLWIVRINAAARIHGLSYSRLVHGLKKAGSGRDRKGPAGTGGHDPARIGNMTAPSRAGQH